MGLLKLLVIVLLIAAAVGGYLYYKKSSTSPTGSTGSPKPPSCKNPGESCSSKADCCDELDCDGGVCTNQGLQAPLQSFLLLSEKGMCITVSDLGALEEGVNGCSWSTDTNDYWFWDGISQLSYRVIARDANGNPVSVKSQSLATPSGEGYPSLSDTAGNVRLTADGAIYSEDFTLCLDIEDTGKLVWKKCLGVPYTFTITPPTGCSTNGQCSVSAQCCPPFNSCVNGACNMCLGNPVCQNPTDYSICDPKTQQFICVSHCTGTITCQSNEHSVCEDNHDGTYNAGCESNCQDVAPSCDSGHLPVCTGSGNSWSWQCPFDPCSQPSPPISNAPVPPDYTLKGDHFEGPAGKAWLYPSWQCQTQTWVNHPGCNTGYYQTCSTPNTKATCNASTNFDWECTSQQDGTDLCGLNATKPTCQDAMCQDLNACGAVTSPGNNWNWVCPSDTSTTLCQLESIYGWDPVQYSGYQGDVIVDTNGVPLYPTVLDDKCRSTIGSYTQYPDQIPKANNPGGTVLDMSGTHTFVPYPSTLDGNGKYVYTDSGHKWNCPTPNPCYPNGTFVTMTGSVWSPIVINPPAGVWGSPSQEELSTVGMCSCSPGFAGHSCQYPASVCNGGAISTCDTDSGRCVGTEYMCMCPDGKYGLHCQFTRDSCKDLGVPENDSDTLTCVCDEGYSGTPCAATCGPTTFSQDTPPIPFPSGNYQIVWADDGWGDISQALMPTEEIPLSQSGCTGDISIGNGKSKYPWVYDNVKQTLMYNGQYLVFDTCHAKLRPDGHMKRWIIGKDPSTGGPCDPNNDQCEGNMPTYYGIYNVDTKSYVCMFTNSCAHTGQCSGGQFSGIYAA
jgi:hypothetical protein